MSPAPTPALPDPDAPLPEGDDKARSIRALFDTIAPRYDMLNRILTLRMDVGMRRVTIAELGLAKGSVVVDLACGTGDLCNDLEAAGLHPVGVDLSFQMLANSTSKSSDVQADALTLPFPDGSVDGVTCGFALRNFVDLEQTLIECARIIRPGGRIALLDVDEPDNPVLRAGHSVYFNRVVPLIGGLLSDKRAYSYLPRSVAYLPRRPELLAMVASAGFVGVEHQQLKVGIGQLITATRI